MAKRIFTITVVSGDPESRDDAQRMRSRCWGYYFKKDDAEQVIRNNETDISELGYYRYGVLARLGEGPLPTSEELQWFEFIWNRDTEPREHDGIQIPDLIEVKEISKPEQYQHYLFGGL